MRLWVFNVSSFIVFLQNIVNIRFQHICLGAVHRLDAVALDQQAQGTLGLPCSEVGHLGGVLHGNAQTGHAGIHQHDVLPAAQQGDDALGLTVVRLFVGLLLGLGVSCGIVCVVIGVVAQTARGSQIEFADHEVGHEIADEEERHHAEHKVDDITAQTGLQGHGDAGDEFQIAEGVQAQMDDTSHGKGTALQDGVYNVQRHGAEHEHELQRLGHTGEEHSQRGGNEHGFVILALVGIHAAVHGQCNAQQQTGGADHLTNLLATVTPARFKVGQMIGATGLLLGVALAMYRRVDADKRKNYRSMFISTALAVFLTGVTEPLEFMFMFCAMPLYIVYAILQGCAFAMAGIIHLRLHSFGNLEFITRIPMSLQAGLGGDIVNFVICVVAFFIIGYFVAYFMIGKLNLATPGRLGNYTDDNAPDEDASGAKAEKKSDNGQAERIIALLGGRENIVLVDACMTRLRVTVKDPAKVADLAAWKAEGALSLLVKGDGIQAVYGPKADVLKSDINDIL